MPFRWLTVIALCVFLSHGLHAQPVTAPSETETEISQPAKSPSREEQLRTLLDTIQQVETEQTTLNRQLKRTADAAEAKQLIPFTARIYYYNIFSLNHTLVIQ